MKILNAEQVRKADAYTIKTEPILSINLMERAAAGCTDEVTRLYNFRKGMHIFVGPGNNGGDGLVIARKLYNKGYSVSVYIVKFTDNYSTDFQANLKRLKNETEVLLFKITSKEHFPVLTENDIIIDSIFGSGLSRPVEGLPKDIIESINISDLPVLAIDTPSGLNAEQNFKNKFTAIKATYTFTFECPFLSFFFAENEKYVGELIIVPIGVSPEYIKNVECNNFMLEKSMIEPLMIKHTKFSHKGTNGHGLLIAGSYGKAGASILAAKSAHRSGAGLISAAVPACNYQILQVASPETMLEIDDETKHISKLPDISNYSALAIGPAIGFHAQTKSLLEKLINESKTGIIFDADAITIFGKRPDLLKKIPKGSILTPHPKEFERIAEKQDDNFLRLQKQREMAVQLKSVIILKGAHTSICLPDGNCYFNTTGNPGMATGGSGDVLTGILLGLMSRGYSPEKAAILGVYVHGLAGDRAAEKYGFTSMIAGDIVENISFEL